MWSIVCRSIVLAPAILAFALSSPRAQQLGSVAPWVGPSLGASIFGGMTRTTVTETQAATGALLHHYETFGSGVGGAVDFGYAGSTWNNQILLGGVGEIGDVDDSGGRVFQTATGVMASARLRAGFAIAPDLLFYGFTGVAIADKHVRIDFGGPITNRHQTTPGAVLGVGGEYALGSASAVPIAGSTSLFAEYEHIWWASNSTSSPPAAPTLNFRWRRDGDLIKAGARLRF